MTVSRTTALALAPVIALAFAAVVFGGWTFADTGWLGAIGPARAAAGDAIVGGHVPGWWDGAGLGVPLVAEASHGALYPPTWLAAAGGRWLDVVAIAHLWLFAIGAAALARRLGADAAGGLVAGAAAALAGITTGALVGGALFALAWSPLAAGAALDVAAAREAAARARAAIVLALAVAASALAGAPAVTAWTALAAIALVAFAADAVRPGARAVLWTVAAIALGGLAAAVQLAPALLHALDGYAAGGDVAQPGPRLLALLVPGAAPSAGWPSLAGGAAICALAALAPVRARGAALALVLGGLWSPAAAAVAWGLVAALAGVGLTALASGAPDDEARARGERRALRIGADPPPARLGPDELRALAVVGGLALALAAAAALRYPLAGAIDRAGLDGPALVERGLARGAIAIVFAAGVVGAALLAARRGSAGLAAGAGLAAVIEVAMAGRAAVPRIERPGRPALALTDGALTRVFRSPRPPAGDDDDPARKVAIDVHRLAAASGAPWGAAAFPASDPARLAAEDALVLATAADAARVIDRYALPRAIVPGSIAVPADLSVLAHRGDETLVATSPQRPAAFWTTRWRRATDADALAAISPPPGQPPTSLAVIHLAGSASDEVAGEPGPLRACALDRPRAGQVVQVCDVTAAGHAVLLDAWAPGWSATVDGRGAHVERADVVARAVAVPAGARVIAWRYRTPGLGLGALVSALALVNLALAAWLTRRPR